MVSAWAGSAGLVLAQRQMAEGSNEIATVPEILQQLVLTGCIVTADFEAANFAVVRHFALNLLKLEKTSQR